MNEWWQSLVQRERLLVSVMGGLVVLAMMYWLLLMPLFSGASDYRERVATAETDLAWMKKMAPKIAAAPVSAGTQPGDTLISIVDKTTRQFDLKTRGNQMVGADKLRVQLDQCSFDTLVKWFGVLQSNYNVLIDTANFSREIEQAGTTNATVTVQKVADL